MLQRAGSGGRRQPAGGGDRRGPGAQRQEPGRADVGQDRRFARGLERGRNSAGGHRLFQRGQCRGLRKGGNRTGDRDGPPAAPSAFGRTLRAGAGRAGQSDASRGDGASFEDASRPGALRPAQADPRTGVRHHQVRARVPSIFTARAGKSARRVEPCDHGLEHEANVRPRPRLLKAGRPGAHNIQLHRRSNRPNRNARKARPGADRRRNAGRPVRRPPARTQSDRLLAALERIKCAGDQRRGKMNDSCGAATLSAGSISARIDRLPATRTIWTYIVLLGFGMFFELYDLLFSAYVAPSLVKLGVLTATTAGLFGTTGVASFIAALFTGLFIGTILCGFLADRYGRRAIFTWSLLWYSAANIMVALQTDAFGLNLWRLVSGIGLGVEMVTIGAYLSELAPKGMRGRAFAVNQAIGFVCVPVASFLAYVLVPAAVGA